MSDAAENGLQLPDYENPPIVEVACGVSFKFLESIRVPHFGLFWASIRDEYPFVEHAVRLGELPESFTVDRFPLPRVFFIHKEQNHLIQLQEDRILFNWRKRNSTDVYPRFEFVFEEFKKIVGLFNEFLTSNELGEVVPQQCELSYYNHLDEGVGWTSVDEINGVFPSIVWNRNEGSVLPNPNDISARFQFVFPDDAGSLQVSIKHGRRRSDNKQLFLLEQTARGMIPNSTYDNYLQWYELAHKWIVSGFSEITDRGVQSDFWGKK